MQLDPSQAQQVSPQNLISKNFSHDTTVCMSKRPATFICTDQDCFRDNVYLCGDRECECWVNHEDCTFVKMETFVKKLKGKVFSTEPIETCVDKAFDGLIDMLSIARDELIGQIRKGKANHHFSNAIMTNKLEECLNETKTLSGSKIHELLSTCSDKQNHQKSVNLISIINQICNDFKTCIFTSFTNELTSVLINNSHDLSVYKRPPNQIEWNKKLAQKLQINGCRVNAPQPLDFPKFCLLQPAISQLYGRTIKWRIKFNYISGWIGVGLALKNKLKSTRYQFDPTRFAQNACYILNTKGMNYAYQNYCQNQNDKYGLHFIAGDIAAMQLNIPEWTLKFRNERTNLTSILNVLYHPQPSVDELHICVVFQIGKSKAEIQFFGNLETDQAVYTFKNSEEKIEVNQ